MPDISMCQGNNCQVRTQCYRHTAHPSYRQSMTDFTQLHSFNPETGCDEFIDTRTRSMFKRVEAQMGHTK